MKRIMAVSVLLLFSVFIGLSAAPQASAAEDVKIGVILPLTGPLATIGQTCRHGLDFAVKEVNEAGGVKAFGGAKIKLLYADSRGDPKIGLSEAERLIIGDKVSALLGAYQSSVTLTTTQVAERYKVPYMVLIAVSGAITERGFKYTFKMNEKADWTGRDIIWFLDEMGKQTSKPMKTLGLLYENTEWGQTSAKSWQKYSKEKGFQIVLDEAYPHGTTDMTPVVLKFKQANPDCVINASYIADMILLLKTMAENKYMPKVFISAGGGEVQPEFIKAVGDQAEYLYSAVPGSGDAHVKKTWYKAYAEAFEKENKVAPHVNSNAAYATISLLLDALERAGSNDREKIRDALAATKITQESAKTNPYHAHTLLFPYQGISFGPDGQNHEVRLLITQFQKQALRVVYPPDFALPGVKPIWPVPGWDERKK